MELLFLTKINTPIIGWVAEILGVILNFIFKLGIQNIGFAIIIFTIIINIIMLPMTIKQQESSKLMAVMQPEIKVIQNKYKGKTDSESAMRMRAETSAVYEKYGTSMTGGCLPLLIQMPILLALYQVIYKIPAYVDSVKVVFQNIATRVMGQAGYIEKITEFATKYKLPVTKIDYTNAGKLIDLLYKFNPDDWTKFTSAFNSDQITAAVNESLPHIVSMNSFFGIDLSTNPWHGFTPNLAWIIPILAGLTQWLSTRLMSNNTNPAQSDADDPNNMANQMKAMNNIMPLMSVYFCFIFPAAIGIYWISSATARIIQQLAINSYLNKIDIEKLIERNLEKANAKRAKKGLAPKSIDKKVLEQAKHINDKEDTEAEDKKLEEKRSLNAKHIKDSTEYYNKDAKPGSMAAKANMVAKYNEKISNKKAKKSSEEE